MEGSTGTKGINQWKSDIRDNVAKELILGEFQRASFTKNVVVAAVAVVRYFK
jgi:hypothetical protein